MYPDLSGYYTILTTSAAIISIFLWIKRVICITLSLLRSQFKSWTSLIGWKWIPWSFSFVVETLSQEGLEQLRSCRTSKLPLITPRAEAQWWSQQYSLCWISKTVEKYSETQHSQYQNYVLCIQNHILKLIYYFHIAPIIVLFFSIFQMWFVNIIRFFPSKFHMITITVSLGLCNNWYWFHVMLRIILYRFM